MSWNPFVPLGDFQNQVLGPKRPATESEGGSGEDPSIFWSFLLRILFYSGKHFQPQARLSRMPSKVLLPKKGHEDTLGYLHHEELIENDR